MMIRHIILLAFIVATAASGQSLQSLAVSSRQQLRPVDSLAAIADLHAGEILILRFASPGECAKCSMILTQAVECVEHRVKGRKRVKTMGAIQCERDIELKAYARRNAGEFMFFIRDDGTLRRRLGIDAGMDLVLIDSAGSIILTGSGLDLNSFCKNVEAASGF